MDSGIFQRRARARRTRKLNTEEGNKLMETRANYVIVGAFVLVCIIGLFIAVLWVAGSQFREEYTYYRTYFTGAVTGLGKGTVVRYNGIDIGHAYDVAIDDADPKRVIVTLQIDPKVKIHVDSVATLESQGLTGAIYVEIEGGTATSPFADGRAGAALSRDSVQAIGVAALGSIGTRVGSGIEIGG